MAVMADVLRQVPYFARFDATLLKELAGQIHERKYKAGEVILLEGEPCEGLYFVVSGRVKVFKVSREGKEQLLRILGPGRTFNDVPVLDGGPTPAASPHWNRAPSAASREEQSSLSSRSTPRWLWP